MGSANFGTYIQVNGTEIAFYKAIKQYILGLSPRFTCEQDPDDEFDKTQHAGTYNPQMIFKIDGVQAFRLFRSAGLYDGAAEIKTNSIAIQTNDYECFSAQTQEIGFVEWANRNTTYGQSEIYPRKIILSHIISDIFAYFSIAGNYQEEQNADNKAVIWAPSNDKIYYTTYHCGTYNKANVFNLSGITLWDTVLGLSGTFLSRFSYGCPPGTIDYIKSSIYAASGEKVFENRAVYDCTTVTVGDTVSLKDGAYVAIGAHQLVKVS